jgi:hypothetical protein
MKSRPIGTTSTGVQRPPRTARRAARAGFKKSQEMEPLESEVERLREECKMLRKALGIDARTY